MAQAPPNKMKTRPDVPFRMEGNYIAYINSSVQRRVAILRNQCEEVHRRNENYFKSVTREHVNFSNRILRDHELKDWRHDVMTPDNAGECRRFMAQRMYLALHHDKNQDKVHKEMALGTQKQIMPLPPNCNLMNYASPHRTPDVRFRIAKNITFNEYNQIPVYCDVSKSLDEVKQNIPETLAFQYIDENVVDPVVEKHLANAVKMAAESPRNQIRCDCRAKGKRCDEVKECPCYEMNEAMRQLQYAKKEACLTKFSSLEPILFKHSRELFYGYVGFACSKLCDCEGKCSNNALFLIEKKTIPLEIYRSNMIVGFGIRSPVFIPAGTPVMEFTGEFLEAAHIDEENTYTYQCTYPDDDKWRLFLHDAKTNFEENYKKLLILLHEKTFYLDPTFYGNIGRMAGHACCPNMEIVRVFKESLSPAHMSFIMVTIEDVYPGTPLTIDYGSKYHLEKCLCKTFGCRSGVFVEEFKKYNVISLASVIKQIQMLRLKNFEKTVKNPLAAFRRAQERAKK